MLNQSHHFLKMLEDVKNTCIVYDKTELGNKTILYVMPAQSVDPNLSIDHKLRCCLHQGKNIRVCGLLKH